MFEDPGSKIKGFAQIWFGIQLVLGIIASISFFSVHQFGLGLIFLAIGTVGAWLASLLLYGFGEIIEHLEAIRNNSQVVSAKLYYNNTQSSRTRQTNAKPQGETAANPTASQELPTSYADTTFRNL